MLWNCSKKLKKKYSRTTILIKSIYTRIYFFFNYSDNISATITNMKELEKKFVRCGIQNIPSQLFITKCQYLTSQIVQSKRRHFRRI